MKKAITSLEFDHMGFSYDNGVSIFNDVTFVLPKSKAIWVRSPGGRGKSTLLKILAGLITPQTGRYLINGQDVNQMSFEEFLDYRMNIGYGFDMGGLLNNKTLYENLSLPLQYHKLIEESEVQERIKEVMNLFGMETSQDQRPYAVSGSQRKLTCLIRAFIHWPQVVFLDDPLNGLKQDNLNDLIHYVEEGFSGRGLKQMFFTSESPELAKRFNAEELLILPDWFTTRAVA